MHSDTKAAAATDLLASEADLEHFILQVHRVASALAETPIFAKHGIGLAEWTVLKNVGASPTPLRELRWRAQISRQRLSTILNELQQKDLVILEGGETSHRSQTVSPSPIALATMHEISRDLAGLAIAGKPRQLQRADKIVTQLLRALVRLRLESSADKAASHSDHSRHTDQTLKRVGGGRRSRMSAAPEQSDSSLST